MKNGPPEITPDPAGFYAESPILDRSLPFVCTWVNLAGTERKRVLPDNCADFIVSSDGGAWLVGPPTRVELPALRPGVRLHGLRIRTDAIRAVTGIEATELTDRTVAIDDLLSSRAARLLVDALRGQGSIDAVVAELWPETDVNRQVTTAIRALTEGPAISFDSLSSDLAYSPRHLRRMVLRETGLAPKMIQRVSRLQAVLDLSRRSGIKEPATLAASLAYTDQAHLARDVRHLADLTPKQLVAGHG